jgi:hypothetical protein
MKKRNTLQIFIALLTTCAMVLGIAGCNEKTFTPLTEGEGEFAEIAEIEAISAELEEGIVAISGNLSLEDVVRGAFADAMNEYSSVAGLIDAMNVTSADMSLTLTPEEYIKNLLGVEKLNPTVLEMTSVVDGANLYSGFSYLNGAEEMLSGDVWLNGAELIMHFPQLFAKYFFADLGADDMPMLWEMILNQTAFDMPSEAAVNALIDSLLSAFFNVVDYETESGVEIDINGHKFKTDKTTIEVTDLMGLQITYFMLEDILNNDDIWSLYESLFGMSMYPGMNHDYDYRAEAQQSLEWLAEEIFEYDEDDAEGGAVITMDVYVSGSDIVRCVVNVIEYMLDIEYIWDAQFDWDSQFDWENMTDEEYDAIEWPDFWADAPKIPVETTIILSMYDKGDKYFAELVMSSDDVAFIVTEDGKRHGDKMSGKIKVDYVDTTFADWGETVAFELEAEYKDISMNELYEFTGGEIIIRIDEESIGKAAMKLTFAEDSFAGTLTLGGIRVATAELAWAYGVDAKPVPELNPRNSVNLLDFDYDVKELDKSFNEGLDAMLAKYTAHGVDLIGFFVVENEESIRDIFGVRADGADAATGADSDSEPGRGGGDLNPRTGE